METLVACLHDTSIQDDSDASLASAVVSAYFQSQSAGSADDDPSPDTSAQDDIAEPSPSDEDDTLLAHLTKRKPLPAGNLKRLLSPSSNAKSNDSSKTRDAKEVTIDGTKYRKVNMAKTMYAVSSSKAARPRGALVDRGANGSIGGSDVRVLSMTDRHVDIQGIDNHHVNDTPIASVGAVVNTQKGPVIAVMHQVAYTGKGKSIVSSLQLEAFKQTVDDKSIKAGGQQHIRTLEGYVIPLNIRHGLAYVSFRPPTDKELKDLPHVTLTADVDWDPSVFDNELEDEEEWFNALEDIPPLSPDPFFDEFGDYRHVHHVTEAILSDSVIENSIITDLPSTFHEYETRIKPRAIDFERFRSKFAWQPVDIIKRTFENTTQFYRSTATPSMKQRYKSPFPACNVHRRSEPVATDTIYSDTPAIDSGVTSAQFFVGTESLVCDVYPMQTDKQFVNTLQDNIRKWGAMTKLISDRAQVEISKKVNDILRHLIIGDWQSEPHKQHQNPAKRHYQDV